MDKICLIVKGKENKAQLVIVDPNGKQKIYSQTDFTTSLSSEKDIFEYIEKVSETETPEFSDNVPILYGTGKIIKIKITPPDIDIGIENGYYKVHSSKNRKALNKFHNWVKRNISLGLALKTFNSSKISLIDLACGKGGDLGKFKDLKVENALCIDLVEDNIESEGDGAKMRWNAIRDTTKMKVNFAVHDSGKSLSKLDKGLFRKNSYDVVNVQFALHYFFKNKTMFKTLINNVSMSLKEDSGYFVGTCYDGDNLFRLLSQKDEMEGYSKKEKELIWKITSKLTKKQRGGKKISPEAPFGYKIDVYMNTFLRVEEEYLVNWETLVNELRTNNIRPLTQSESYKMGFPKGGYDSKTGTGSFKNIIDNLEKKKDFLYHLPKKELIKAQRLVKEMEGDEISLSSLNTVFVYKKN
jgi:hypothetical protein